MDLQTQLHGFRKEHDTILAFLSRFQHALLLAHGPADEQRRSGLTQLCAMQARLRRIREHCREEEQNVQSAFSRFLEESDLDALRREHDLLDQLLEIFLAELKLAATPAPTRDMCAAGQDLLARLRHHIAFEEGLLKQIENASRQEGRLSDHPQREG